MTLTIGFTLSGCITTQSDVEKIGSVIKLGKSGIFCPTWEGEIIRTRMFVNNGTQQNTAPLTITGGQEFEFTVKNPEALAKLQYAMNNQKEVKVVYHRELITFCSSDSVNYFVDDVQILN